MVPEIWRATDRSVCHFALLPPTKPEIQNFEKMKKAPGDTILLQMCTINVNHMMYNS